MVIFWIRENSIAIVYTMLRSDGVRKWQHYTEHSEYREACRSIGMAVPRGLLRGYDDRREEASFDSKPVDHIKNEKI